jgi:hypothetical protein
MKYLLLFVAVAFCSCSPKIRTAVAEKHEKLSEANNVVVFGNKSELPAKFVKIGTTSIGDTGFTTNCSFNTVIEKAKIEASNSGANALLITKHLYPSVMGSSCHRIKADLLRIENIEPPKQFPITIDSTLVNHTIKNVQTEQETYSNVVSFKGSKKSGFLFTANVAQSFRVASSPDGLNSEQKDYLRKLKSGLSYDVSAYYLKEGKAGFGVKYNAYKSSGTLRNQDITLDDGTVFKGDLSDDITISFVGPSFILTEDTNARVGEANLELAVGYISYLNKATVAGSPIKMTGGNVGMIGGMGYHFRITPHLLVGPQVSFIGGVLKKMKYKYEDGSEETVKFGDEEFENLWRIDLAIGAKLRF